MLAYMENTDTPTLAGFLEEIALYTDIEQYDPDADAVVMMTMHAAKGLEFPNVFLTGFEEGLFPSNRCLSEPEELEEERRLCLRRHHQSQAEPRHFLRPAAYALWTHHDEPALPLCETGFQRNPSSASARRSPAVRSRPPGSTARLAASASTATSIMIFRRSPRAQSRRRTIPSTRSRSRPRRSASRPGRWCSTRHLAGA
ncbi:MAG: 3'-5' exonuclease [Acutalibacteraceae bacterium]